jgi:LPS-assembly lipoprotein
VRTFENPDVEVLGKQQEAELIYQDLTDEEAIRILARMRAALD